MRDCAIANIIAVFLVMKSFSRRK